MSASGKRNWIVRKKGGLGAGSGKLLLRRFLYHLNLQTTEAKGKEYHMKKECTDSETWYFQEVTFQYGCFLLIWMASGKASNLVFCLPLAHNSTGIFFFFFNFPFVLFICLLKNHILSSYYEQATSVNQRGLRRLIVESLDPLHFNQWVWGT